MSQDEQLKYHDAQLVPAHDGPARGQQEPAGEHQFLEDPNPRPVRMEQKVGDGLPRPVITHRPNSVDQLWIALHPFEGVEDIPTNLGTPLGLEGGLDDRIKGQ